MMTPSSPVLPYYYPSTVVVIDDDRAFLDSFQFRYGSRLLCRTFDDAKAAVQHIERTTPATPRHRGCLEASLDAAIALGVPPSDQAVIFHPSVIRNVVHDPDRFAEVSVAIVDYDMPGENGMEICRRLRNHPVRTVMLTGKADEKLATSAFNQGLIDRFVLKHDSATVDRLDELIAELQLDYFDRMRSELSGIIGLQESAFLGDGAFGQLLDKILKREKAVEYYLSHTPPGLLMLRADGTARMLLVQHDDALAVYKADEGAVDGDGMPPGLSARIAGGGWQPWFPTPHGLYTSDCRANWEDHLYPAERVGPWHCSVIDGDALSGVLERPVFSYKAYRRRPHQEVS
jgi:CheY-like chemotaxis protein